MEKQCLTGCVATAMAQIMKYHEYPALGKGTYSYVTRTNLLQLGCDFSNLTFDWESMPNNLSLNSPSAQREAVSTLMLACGVGASMDYSLDESIALDATMKYALYKYFGYSSDMEYVRKDEFCDAEWNDMLYKELSEERPVFYSGRGDNGGHAFVCDGYKNGLFHINWGWEGQFDGYFRLSGLCPRNYNYNSDQHAVIGIRPASNDDETKYGELYCRGDFEYHDNDKMFHIFDVYSISPEEDFSCQMGLNIVNENQPESNEGYFLPTDYFPSFPPYNLNTGYFYGYNEMSMFRNISFSDGKYRIYPAYKISDKWRRLRCPIDKKRYVHLVVKNGINQYSDCDEAGIVYGYAEYNGNPHIEVFSNRLIVDGVSGDTEIIVLSLNGDTLYHGCGNAEIFLKSGFYLVKINNYIDKLFIP